MRGSMNSTILFAISSHGLGHLGQTAPIINALGRMFPELDIVISAGVNNDTLHQFVEIPFIRYSSPRHATVIMDGPLNVDVKKTLREFSLWHESYLRHLTDFRNILENIQPNLVVTNIDYTVIDSAGELGIPSISLCSLNWADILLPFIAQGQSSQLYHSILSSYNNADCFIQLRPHLSMPGLNNTVSIDPVARLGHFRRAEINDKLSLECDTQLVLFSLGGIPMSRQVTNWNIPEKSHWILPDYMVANDSRFSTLSELRIPFIDVLASSDVLVTKPGYGSFVEAYLNATKIISVRRERWAESSALVDWLIEQNMGIEMTSEDFYHGNFLSAFENMPSKPVQAGNADSGVNSAIKKIVEFLP